MFRFYLQCPGGKVLLPRGEILVGRGPDCDVRFNDGGVSRRHLRLTVTHEWVTAEDLGSKNGTLVNGQRLAQEWRLAHDDELRVGEVLMRLRVGPDAAVAAFDDDTNPAQGFSARPTPELALQSGVTCSRCGALSPIDADVCLHCSQGWPRRRSACHTQELPAIDEL